MKYYPVIIKLVKDINDAQGYYGGIWRRQLESQLAFIRRNVQSEIDMIMYGFKTYNQVLTSLGGTVKETTNSMVSSWNRVTDAVRETTEVMGGSVSVAPGAWGISKGTVLGAYPHGTPFVPRTGLYQLERGERVTPANQNTYNTFSPSISMTVQGGGSPNRIAQEVEKVLYETGRQFKRRGFEIIPGRG